MFFRDSIIGGLQLDETEQMRQHLSIVAEKAAAETLLLGKMTRRPSYQASAFRSDGRSLRGTRTTSA